MIRCAGTLDPPAPRLLVAVEAKSGRPEAPTLVVGPGCHARQLDDALTGSRDERVLVMSAIGTHPDARAPRLKNLWDLEERARAAGRPVLTLRLAPIVGPASPLWLRLRSRPRLPEPEHLLLNPVIEDDVVETMARALDGRAAWEGWYEVAGEEVWTLSELAALAATSSALSREAGGWEPPVDELREHRIAEADAWSAHFGIAPQRVSEEAPKWR